MGCSAALCWGAIWLWPTPPCWHRHVAPSLLIVGHLRPRAPTLPCGAQGVSCASSSLINPRRRGAVAYVMKLRGVPALSTVRARVRGKTMCAHCTGCVRMECICGIVWYCVASLYMLGEISGAVISNSRVDNWVAGTSHSGWHFTLLQSLTVSWSTSITGCDGHIGCNEQRS